MNFETINPDLHFEWTARADSFVTNVKVVEAELGLELPGDYRAFSMLGHNLVVGNFVGATTNAVKVRYEVGSRARELLAYVGVVFSLDRALEHSRCFSEPMQLYDIGPRIPPQMFVVAHDNGRGWYLMQLAGDTRGSIWYWERQDVSFGLSTNTTLALVAPSFDAFIGSITTPERVERMLTDTGEEGR